MQDYGVNLICVDDGIDSSKGVGKMMIAVLSSISELEKENINAQTMEGRIQKAREGKWNGGFPPYGYSLKDGQLFIEEAEAEAVRIIFDKYVNTYMGCSGVAHYLEVHGIKKIMRHNGKSPLFSSTFVRRVLSNPVYSGKIAYMRRRTEKIPGTRNEYHLVDNDNYLLVNGLHEDIVSEDVWDAAQVKLTRNAVKYRRENRNNTSENIHLLSGIVKCPLCGAGMYANKCIKYKKNGEKYKDYYYYGCKHRKLDRGYKCTYRTHVGKELLEAAVLEVITKLVSKPKFMALMQQKINVKLDTTELDKEIEFYTKLCSNKYTLKAKLLEEMDALDFSDKHYEMKKSDLANRLEKAYDAILDAEKELQSAKARKGAIEAEHIASSNILEILSHFNKLYEVMDASERRKLIELLISEIQIYPERQPNGQWLKSIAFKFPIIEHDMDICLDANSKVECVVLMSRVKE